jgi:shikimate dehydrogenase
MSNQVFRLGLTGWPLDHSISPAIHLAALKASDLAGEYALYPVPPLPAGGQGLDTLTKRLRRRDMTGLNVTIPHKQSILPLLDRFTEVAEAASAVNLVYLDDGLLMGDNSDAPAFMSDLHRTFGFSGQPGKALVLGAGGAARAAVYALLHAGWMVSVASRRLDAAQQLVKDVASQAINGSHSLHALLLKPFVLRDLPDCELVVNATPVGMFPNIHETPWPEKTSFPPRASFYDMVYNPTETVLVKSARLAGLPAANGLGMLVEQAALSFERWTGIPADRDIMREAAVVSLSRTESHRLV